MPPAGFQPAIPADERLQTHVLDRSATGIGEVQDYFTNRVVKLVLSVSVPTVYSTTNYDKRNPSSMTVI
jgi:hypothetical protein